MPLRYSARPARNAVPSLAQQRQEDPVMQSLSRATIVAVVLAGLAVAAHIEPRRLHA
jgi:hypothetical protein